MQIEELDHLLRSRRSVYPEMYEEKEIPDELILHILENASWAPNHKLTEPWRFKIFKGDSLRVLGEFLGEKYKANTTAETFSPVKYKKTIEKPLKCGCIIAVCIQPDPEKRLPEEEELLAVGAAVQNMWLSCTVLGIGSYLSTPSSIHKLSELVTFEEGERCIGLFYMGWRKPGILESKRTSISEKTSWI